MKDAVVIGSKDTINVRSLTVDWNGWSFKVIYGLHGTQWFVAITNFEACARIAEPNNEDYNTERIAKAINNREWAEKISNALSRDWKEWRL